MKKSYLIAVIVIIIAAGAATALFVANRDKEQPATTNTTTTDLTYDQPQKIKEACEIFTPAIAKDILGSVATKKKLPGGGSVTTASVNVSQCLYDNGSSNPKDLVTATILVRSAKDASFNQINNQGFDETKSSATGASKAVDIADLGDGAWYNPSLGQVNVKVDGGKYWIITGVHKGSKPVNGMAEKLARAVVANL